MAVYKGIAPGEDRKSLPSMDVSSRKLANGLVQLAFSLGDQVGTLGFCKELLLVTVRSSALEAMQITCVNEICSFIKQTEQLVGLLLNSITLSLSGSLNRHFLSFSHGEYFYSLFQSTTNKELLRQLDRSVPLLLTAATQSPGMVNLLL